MSEEYSARLERAASSGFSARDCRDYAGKGISPAVEWMHLYCPVCYHPHDDCSCDAPPLAGSAPVGRFEPKLDPEEPKP